MKTMDCDCIEIIQRKLEAHHGTGSEVELELKATVNLSPGSDVCEMGEAMPPLYYTYRAGKKRKRSYVTFAFCPFCGKRSKP